MNIEGFVLRNIKKFLEDEVMNSPESSQKAVEQIGKYVFLYAAHVENNKTIFIALVNNSCYILNFHIYFVHEINI